MIVRSLVQRVLTTTTRQLSIHCHLNINTSNLYSIHRRRSGWNSGGTHGERRRWVGAEWDGAYGGVSPLQPTRGSGGASWAPPAGQPRPKTDFGVFWRSQNAPFCTYMTKIWGEQFALASPVLPSPRYLRPWQHTTARLFIPLRISKYR